MYMVVSLPIYLCTTLCRHGGQNRVLDSLQLESQAVTIQHVVGAEHRLPGRAASALKP